MKNSLLVFGTKNLNNSLDEIKEYLDFSLIFFHDDTLFNETVSIISALLVDSEASKDIKNFGLINKVNSKPIILIEKQGFIFKCNHTNKISFPLTLSDFNSKILTFIASEKFNQNSSIEIKEYKINKNEKKLKKDDLFISLTEKEIELIEILYNEKKSLSKSVLLKKIWKYSEVADTHTVETHIYRLRKKILIKFNDEKFIIHSRAGYSI